MHKNLPEEMNHLRKYLEWMEYNFLNRSSKATQRSQSDLKSLSDDLEYLAKLEQVVEGNDAEGQLIVRVAKDLPRILNGEVDALNLLFDDALICEYYRYSQRYTSAFPKVLRWLDAFAHKHPDLKILEIGGGLVVQLSSLSTLLHNTGRRVRHPGSRSMFLQISLRVSLRTPKLGSVFVVIGWYFRH